MMPVAKKTIVFLSHVSHLTGGAERSLFETVKYLKLNSAYNPVVIIPSRGDLYESLRQLGCTVYIIESNWWTSGSRSKQVTNKAMHLHDAHALYSILSVLDAEKPVACITNTIVVPWLAYASAIKSIPHIWYLHEYGALDHGLDFMLGETSTLNTIDAFSSKIIANSNSIRKHFNDSLPVHKNKLLVSYPFTDTFKTEPTITNPFEQGRGIKLVCIGQIKRSKGQLDAVHAVYELEKRNIKAQLCLVGTEEDSLYTDEIKSFIKDNLKNNSVIFTGFSQSPLSMLRYADISLVCSINEAFGLVATESMSQGTPVVGTNSGGLKEIITDQFTGLLYETGDITGLTNAIAALHKNEKLVQTLIANAKKIFIKKYSIQASIRPLVNYLDNIQKTTSIDLSPLDGILDIDSLKNNSIETLNIENTLLKNQLQEILNSKKWRLITKISKLLPKKTSR